MKNSHKRRQGNVSEGLTTYKYSTKPNKRKEKENKLKIGESAFSPFSRAISKIRQLSTNPVFPRVYTSLPAPTYPQKSLVTRLIKSKKQFPKMDKVVVHKYINKWNVLKSINKSITTRENRRSLLSLLKGQPPIP